jgi:Fe-S-cluster containining protein
MQTPMTNNPLPDNNENLTLCRKCGGACCRTRPGIEAPERFLATGNMADNLMAALSSGDWVLEIHIGLPLTEETSALPDRMDIITRYPRPATIQEKTRKSLFAIPGTGDCTFLTDKGCTLPFTERPRLCRSLEPDSFFDCDSSWKRPDAALAWHPWQSVIEQVLVYLGHPAKLP